MNPLSITCLLHLLLLLVVADAFSLFPKKTHVQINNDLSSGIDLTVHCKSKDDNLGEQHLGYHNNFDFGFRPSIFQNTLFFCSFQWNGITHQFDIYVQMRESLLCRQCVWDHTMEFPIQFQEHLLSALLFTIILTILVATILVKGNKDQQRRPPEPAGAIPLLGHLHRLGNNKLLHRTLADMADKYGPAFSIRLGVHRALVVSNWEVAKECFTTNDKVFLNRPKSLAIEHMGYGLNMFGLGPYGQYWRDMRKLVTVELLSSGRLELLKHVPDTEIDIFLKELYEQTVKSGGVAVVDMKEIIGDLATNIIVRMVVGKRYCGAEGSCNEESRRCQKAMADFLHLAGVFLVSDAVPFLGWLDVVMGNIGKMKRIAKELDFTLESWLNERRERRQSEETKGDKDFIDVMLSIMDVSNVPSQEADVTIKATCLNLILGGGDTTVVTLTWAVSLLLNNRHVLKKVQDELDIHVGKQRQVEESDITNLIIFLFVKNIMIAYANWFISIETQAMEFCMQFREHLLPALVFTIIITILVVTILVKGKNEQQRRPPEPAGAIPLLGHLHLLGNNQLIHRALADMADKYGPAFSIRLGIHRALVVILARLLHGFEWGTVGDKAIDMSESPGLTNHKATPLELGKTTLIGTTCGNWFISMEFPIQFQEQLLFALLSTIIITIFVATILVKGKKKWQRRPPEPDGALPFLGHLLLLRKNQLLHRTFADMADKYGPAFSIRLGIHRALVVSNWEVVKECFTTNDKVFLTRPKSLAIKLMGYDHNMLGFAPYGPYWRSIRKLATVELLSSRRLELLKHVPDTEINSFIKELYELSTENGGVAVVEMEERIGDLATNIIVRMIAGKRYYGTEGSCNEESRRYQKAMGDFSYLGGLFLFSDAVPFLGWLDIVMGNIGKIKQTAKELDFVLGSWVNEHRERRRNEVIKGDQDFIDVMLSIMDESNVPSQEADATIKATCLSLALGAVDTNVVTLTWAVSLLLNNPLARLLHGFEWGTVSDEAIDMSESPGIAVPKATPLEVTLTPKLPSMLYR
ncbi:hypothetical protein V6N13_149668 [Hibiscus sabdariffa]